MKLPRQTTLASVAVIAALGALAMFAASGAAASTHRPVTVHHTITEADAGFNTIAVDPIRHLAYVEEYSGSSGHVAVINTQTGALKALPVPAGSSSIAIDEKADMVYIPDFYTGSIAVLHRTTLVKTITLGDNSEPGAATIDPATGLVYISCSGNVTIVDGTSVVGSVPLADGVIYTAAVDPATGYVYVPTQDGALAVLKAKHLVESITIGATADAVAVDQTRDLIYVTDPEDSKVLVIKGTTVEHTVHIGKYPGEVAVDPANHLAYVGQYMGDKVSILDGGTVKRTAAVGSGPDEAIVDASNGLVLFAGVESGTITVFDGTHTVQSLSTSQNGYQTQSAADPSNGRIYLSSANGNALTELQAPAPGTITIHRPTHRDYPRGARVTVKFHCAPGAANTVTACVGTDKNGHHLATGTVGVHHFTVRLHQKYGPTVTKTIGYRIKA